MNQQNHKFGFLYYTYSVLDCLSMNNDINSSAQVLVCHWLCRLKDEMGDCLKRNREQ